MIELFNAITDRTDLNAQEKSFLFCLLRHTNHKTGECFPSLQTLQLKTGIKSKSTLLKTRQSLLDKGLISYQKSGTKIYYSINIVPVHNLHQIGTDLSTNWSNSRLQTINKQKNKQNKLITNSTTGTNSDLLNFIMSKDNPDYDYLHGFGWMYSEFAKELLSSDFIC